MGFLDALSRAIDAADTAIATDRAGRRSDRQAAKWARDVQLNVLYYALDNSGKAYRFVKKDRLLQVPVTRTGTTAAQVYLLHGDDFAVGTRPGNWFSVHEMTAARRDRADGDPLDDGVFDTWLKDPDVVFDAAIYRELRKQAIEPKLTIHADLRDFA